LRHPVARTSPPSPRHIANITSASVAHAHSSTHIWGFRRRGKWTKTEYKSTIILRRRIIFEMRLAAGRLGWATDLGWVHATAKCNCDMAEAAGDIRNAGLIDALNE